MTPGSCCWLKLLIAVTASLYAGGVSGCKPDSATQSESTRTGTEPIQNTGRLTNTVAESDWRSIKEKNEQLAAENRLLRRMLVEGTSQQGNAPTNKAALRPTVSRISTNSADYWITLDKKRHNKKCRYYQIFKEGPADPTKESPVRFAAVNSVWFFQATEAKNYRSNLLCGDRDQEGCSVGTRGDVIDTFDFSVRQRIFPARFEQGFIVGVTRRFD